MQRNQLLTAKDLNKNLQENLDYLKESNHDLSKLVSQRNDEILQINQNNKQQIEKLGAEKERIYEQLNDLQSRYDSLIDQNQGFVQFKYQLSEKDKECREFKKQYEEKD